MIWSSTRIVSAIRMAKSEYQDWLTRLVHGSAFQAAIAFSVNQTVRLVR